MNKSYIREAIDQAKTAAKQATAQVRSALGQTNDPDLMRYNQMQPADFERMTAEYGESEVQRYIQQMETKRMTGGGQ